MSQTAPNVLGALRRELSRLDSVVVAFSGGVDSAMLLHALRAAFAERVLAVTADSPSLPRAELDDARAFTALYGVRHEIVATDELARPGYTANASDRCYFCKTELFETIARHFVGRGERDWPVLYGAIADDLLDHRPGARAAAEHGIRAPLADAGWTKADVRRYSHEHGLPTADKPSFACLASRVPYGTTVDAAVLRKLEAAEAVLRALGFRQFRVRHHGDVARVELLPDDFASAVAQHRDAIVGGIRAAGYVYVALDLRGYRSGSMNEVLR